MCYLASFVALVAGIAWLTQRTFGTRMLSVRLDGAIVALAVGSAAAAIRFQSIPPVSGGALQAAVSTSHPLLDLMLLMLIVAGLALKSYRPPWPAATLMLGVAACVIGDVIYTHQDSAHSFIGLPILNGTWIFGLWLISLAAWADPDQRSVARAEPSRAAARAPHASHLLGARRALGHRAVAALLRAEDRPRARHLLAAARHRPNDADPARRSARIGELPGCTDRRVDGPLEPAWLPRGDQRQPRGAAQDEAARGPARRPERLQGDQRLARPPGW